MFLISFSDVVKGVKGVLPSRREHAPHNTGVLDEDMFGKNIKTNF
jgi:hypothetical protein